MRDQLAEAKEALRRRLTAMRRHLEADARVSWSTEICRRICASQFFQQAATVVSYRPLGAEVDPAGVDREVRESGRELYYPCASGSIGFEEVGPAGRSGKSLSRPPLRPSVLLFMVPGVAFDEAGGRLGRGLGWYDRALAGFDGALRLGVAFEAQIVPRVPVGRRDVAMNVVMTERRCIVPERSRLLGGDT